MAICPFMSNPDGDISCVEGACQVWDSINSRCGTLTSDVQIHVHNSHRHGGAHSGCGFSNDCGGPFIGNMGMTPASTLIMEFMNNQDLDGNGLVYGFDFKIEDNEDKPPVIKSIEDHEDWKNPTKTRSWNAYLNSPTTPF